ncbi:hypothetical protein WMY93_020268 [Mugilogobius chulae]|uniref:C2H2-type domain-containing protein n=1 Tax=Mugilogobius chulae TaxID=88201 RepID=A0AAW0NGM2_9GOBI
MDFVIIDENPDDDDDVIIRDEPEIAKPDEEEYPFTIIAVTIGDNGNVEQTEGPVLNVNPQTQTTNHEKNYEQVDDSSETDNSEDWNDDSESESFKDITTDVKQASDSINSCPYCDKTFERKYNLENHRAGVVGAPHGNPQRRKTVLLRDLQQEVHDAIHLRSPYENPHRRATLQLQHLLQNLQTSQQSGLPHQNAQRGKTLQLSDMLQKVHEKR